jgi:hypothetical protein
MSALAALWKAGLDDDGLRLRCSMARRWMGTSSMDDLDGGLRTSTTVPRPSHRRGALFGLDLGVVGALAAARGSAMTGSLGPMAGTGSSRSGRMARGDLGDPAAVSTTASRRGEAAARERRRGAGRCWPCAGR